jgi:DNA-binding GntR family transcriptional regulator
MPADRDGAARPILIAPLFAATAGWTSRTIAESTGQSQSAVARVWTHAYTGAATDVGDRLPAGGLRLVAACADARNSILVLTMTGPRDQPSSGPFMRSPRRPALQALLAVDLLATGRPTAAPAAAPPADARVVSAVRRQLGQTSPLYVLCRRPLDGVADGATALDGFVVDEVVVEDPAAWQGLLADLVRRCTRSATAELVAAQYAAMEWARSDRPRFEWVAFDAAHGIDRTSNIPGVFASPTSPRSASQALADDVLVVLLECLASGRLAGGDRVTESFLARAVHASRSQVRDALRSLAAAGLVDLEPHRGALVPTPQTADVVETYAARRALGAVVVRRAVHWTPGALEPVEQALDDLIGTGRAGNAQATGEADLRFQDALARSTGMRRIPRMFCDLTAQLRVFIAVMGLDYTYSIPGMCQDDTALLEHIRARDEAAAARTWHRKIDDAAAYMTTQLSIANAARPTRRRAGTTAVRR